jgi:diadenosine tetraphosphate (Ap4A) HIT family hydrolase
MAGKTGPGRRHDAGDFVSPFALHPDFESTSIAVGDLELCAVRLQADGRWPWLILIPRRPDVSELDDLDSVARARLMDEQVQAMSAVRAMAEALLRPVAKLNLAALGNVTPQLHVHVIGRRRDDAAWPSPVWGVGQPQPYSDSSLAVALAAARDTLRL